MLHFQYNTTNATRTSENIIIRSYDHDDVSPTELDQRSATLFIAAYSTLYCGTGPSVSVDDQVRTRRYGGPRDELPLTPGRRRQRVDGDGFHPWKTHANRLRQLVDDHRPRYGALSHPRP